MIRARWQFPVTGGSRQGLKTGGGDSGGGRVGSGSRAGGGAGDDAEFEGGKSGGNVGRGGSVGRVNRFSSGARGFGGVVGCVGGSVEGGVEDWRSVSMRRHWATPSRKTHSLGGSHMREAHAYSHSASFWACTRANRVIVRR